MPGTTSGSHVLLRGLLPGSPRRRRARVLGGGLAVALLAAAAIGGATSVSAAPAKTWSVGKNAGDPAIREISYGSGTDFPVFAVVDTKSSYFRMVHSRSAGFATSMVLLPVVRSSVAACPVNGSGLCQGAPVTFATKRVGANLVLTMTGTVAKTLKSTVAVTLSPPVNGTFTAQVSVTNTGSVALDTTKGTEAFKPVFLSSMHEAGTAAYPTKWDARSAFIGDRSDIAFPLSGLLVSQPGSRADRWGVNGGTSAWKANAPTVVVRSADIPCRVNGYVTYSVDPNDDNVGLWCGLSALKRTYTYTLTAKRATT